MKTFIEKDTNIISVADNFVSLKEIRDDQIYVYKIKYLADVTQLFKTSKENRATQVLINVIKNVPKKADINLFDQGLLPEYIVDQLVLYNSKQKDLKRGKKLNVLLSKKSDITKKIPNSLTTDLSKLSFNPSVDEIKIKEQVELKTISVEEVEDAGLVAPILETNLNKILKDGEQELIPQDKEIQKKSLELLFMKGIDPAEFVGQRSNSIVPAKKQYGGLVSNTCNLNCMDDPNNKNNTDILIKSLLTKTLADNHKDLTSAKFVTVPIKTGQIFVEIEETIELSMDILKGDTFLLEFNLMNEKKQLRQQLTALVKHSEIVTSFRLPRVSPSFQAISIKGEGKSILRIKQLDQNATQINIYRKRLSSNEFSLDNPYEQIESVNIKNGEGERIIEDSGIGSSPVLYRAVPVGVDGELGGNFTGLVVRGRGHRNNSKDNFLKRMNFLTLSHEISEKTVRLLIDNITNGPIALNVLRRDRTLNQTDYELIGKTILLRDATERPIEVHDSSVKTNRIYEYICEAIYADGAKIKSGNNILVNFSPIIQNIVNLEIQNLRIEESDAEDIDVVFDIQKNVVLKDFDTIKALLESQGITEYDTDIESNKEKLQNLFFTKVLRINLLSGEVEDFGIINTIGFSDRIIGKVRNVSPLKSGLSYKYVVIAYARATETMIPTLTRTVDTSTNQSYELNPSKFLHPITLNEGNLVTDSSLLRNHAYSQFTQGNVADIKYNVINLGKYTPSVQEIKTRIINDKMILVKWRVVGDATRIDHFLVTLEINGMRTIVGKTHAIGETNEFKLIDTLDNDEHGALEYIVTPVFYDFSRGTEERSEPIIID